MKIVPKRKSALLSLMLLFCFYTLSAGGAASAKSTRQPRFERVAPGLDYAHLADTNQPWSIHVARLTRSRSDFNLLTTLGKGTIQGLESLAGQVQAIPTNVGVSLAAVNGDFF